MVYIIFVFIHLDRIQIRCPTLDFREVQSIEISLSSLTKSPKTNLVSVHQYLSLVKTVRQTDLGTLLPDTSTLVSLIRPSALPSSFPSKPTYER